MTNQQKTFTQVVNSTFDTILSSSNITDKNNQFFIDNNPKLFQHLVNQLREESSKNNCSLTIPSNEDKIVYRRMINDLGLCRK
jgi:BTB/POZ domain-containing protein